MAIDLHCDCHCQHFWSLPSVYNVCMHKRHQYITLNITGIQYFLIISSNMYAYPKYNFSLPINTNPYKQTVIIHN